MKKIYLSFIFLVSTALLQAQQTGAYSHSFYKPMTYNPAFTGLGESTNAMLISRSQFISFKNAPQLNLFMLDGMLPNKKMGVGIDLFTDKKGISNKIGGNAYYSYWLRLNESTKLTFGIALGIIDHTLHYSEAVLETPSDPFIVGSAQRETTLNGHAGLGLTWKKLEAGISVPQLLGNTLEFQDNTSGKAYYGLSRHYQGTLKYQFVISESKQLLLTPMTLVRFHPNAPLQYDVNLNLEWKKKIWLGATYKSDYAVSANAGFCLGKQLSIGYSYDFIIGNIGSYSGMSHELMINFVFGKTKTQNDTKPEIAAVVSRDKEIADSLQTELEIKNNNIKTYENTIAEQNKEIAKLKTENTLVKNSFGDSLPKNSNQNLTTTDNGTKTIENGIMILSDKENKYTYLNEKMASKGFYVIIGSYIYRDLAQAELSRIKSEGYSSADILYSTAKQFNYVSASFHLTKENAIREITKLKAGGAPDVWILSVQ